jgi:hypothetical protein
LARASKLSMLSAGFKFSGNGGGFTPPAEPSQRHVIVHPS